MGQLPVLSHVSTLFPEHLVAPAAQTPVQLAVFPLVTQVVLAGQGVGLPNVPLDGHAWMFRRPEQVLVPGVQLPVQAAVVPVWVQTLGQVVAVP